jgi:RimJ/RimL family protein N-acetyltransferase
MIAPTIHTERLTLRPHQMADFPAYSAFVQSDRARYMGGPHDTRTAWNWFCNDTAQWALLDMGALMITQGGAAIGQVAVCHGPIFPEPELGWFLFEGYEGNGYATEAATTMRDWAFRDRGLTTLVSYIDPANTASTRLALRLGAQLDENAATPNNDPCHAYRINPAVVIQ